MTTKVFDVNLDSLVEELLELWEGVVAQDMSKDVRSRSFQLYAMLLWTIHDFLSYGTVGGFSHQGYLACPWCGVDLDAEHSVELGKETYSGIHQWYLQNHPYKAERMKDHFNDKNKNYSKPWVVNVNKQIQHTIECDA